MKKIIGILLLFLLWNNLSLAKIINIENKVTLNVPENFNYIRVNTDDVADYYADFFGALGEDAAFYYVGTDSSIEFANSLVNNQEKVLEPIMEKMEKKNFRTKKSMINFLSKEIQKLMKKSKYQGIIWVFVSEENLEKTDYDLFETIESFKNMNQADKNKAALEFKKELKKELGVDGVEGLNLKITKFKIEKNEINSPAFDLKIAANMFSVNWDMEVYGYLKNKKPIIVGSECIGTCKGVSGIKNKIVYSKIKTSTSSTDIVDQLNSLNDLYKSGVLTKEEFEKAKKKILN
jgi:uncharacterized protein YqgQ